MTNQFLLPLLENTALLLVMVVVYHFSGSRLDKHRNRRIEILSGLLIGCVGVSVMLVPLHYAENVFFDSRSVVLSLSGLFFGLIPTLLAMAMTSLYRLLFGGVASLIGVLSIVITGGVGLLWRHYRGHHLSHMSWRELYLFGVVTHVCMMAALFLLPWREAAAILRDLAWPILLITPPATTLIGAMLIRQLRRDKLSVQLNKNMELLKFALSASRQSLFDLDVSKGELTINRPPALETETADSSEHVSLAQLRQKIHPEDRPGLETLYREYLAGKSAHFNAHFRIRGKATQYRWIQAAGRLTSQDGELGSPHLLGTFLDVTQSREAEQKLRIFRELIDQSNESIEVFDPDTGRLLDVNETACKALGYSRDELLKLRVMDVAIGIHPQNYPRALDKLRETGVLRWEGLHQRKDGSTFPVEINLKYVRLERDYVVASARDITERREAARSLEEEVSRRRLLVEQSRDGIVILHESGQVYEANQRFAEMLGYSLEELTQLSLWDLDQHRERDFMMHELQTLDATGDFFETRHRRKDGSVFDVEISSNGSIVAGQKLIFCVCRDITERKQTEDALTLAALVYQNSHEAMMVMDARTRIIDVNPTFTKVTGYTREEVLGRDPGMLRAGKQPTGFYHSLWQELSCQGRWEGEIWNKRKNGEEYPQWLSVCTVYNQAGEVYRWVAQFTDITEKKNAEQLIWQQANFDSLTGLPNRHMFGNRLEVEIAKAARNKVPLALMFLDLDHFKEVNDSLGHDKGDILLQQTAQRLQECVRRTDTVSRMGGDEFVIILAELQDSRAVEDIARKILKQLSEPYALGTEMAYVSTSIGISLYPRDAERAEDLLKKADQAMYDAKRKGRNHFQHFTPAMQQAVSTRLRIASDLRSAIAQGQLKVAYQPIVDLATGSIGRAEALLRWEHPEHGLIAPSVFIPIAEDCGLINEIGEWTFREALGQLQHWRRVNPDFRLSINKSPIQFRSNFADSLISILQQAGIPGQCVVVEITEGLLLDANPAIIQQLLAYRDAGVQVALDDFGTGYSSLSYLKKFDIDYLKIDRSFVKNLRGDNEDMVLCTAMITLANQLGLEVIAEGVETRLQRQLLASAGCSYAQGFLFSRPCYGEAFGELLDRQTSECFVESCRQLA